MLRTITLSLVVILSLAVTPHAGISVSQSLSRQQIPFEDSVIFEVLISWDGSQADYHFGRPLNPTLDRLSIAGVKSSVSSAGTGSEETTEKRFLYTLVPNQSGIGFIAPIAISYVTWPDSIPGELMTEGMSVEIADPVPVSDGLEISTTVIIVGVVAGAAILAVIVLLVVRREKSALSTDNNPAEQVLGRLAALKAESDQDLKQFQKGLCSILSDYIKFAHDIDVDEFDDDQVEQALIEAGASTDEAYKVSRWFVEARLDKFRPVQSQPGDVVKLETSVRNYFENK